MNTVYSIGELESFLVAILVLFIGHTINRHVPSFRKYNIPEPIVGGLIVAGVITILHFNKISLEFTLSMQNTLMLMFFSTVGLAASYKLLMKGGTKVIVFLGIASLYIIIQNAVGVSLASALGLEPIMGLIAGSITLSGGHGTGAAWAQTFQDNYGINTLEFAMAAATFGLVMGGIIGGPVAQRLINKHNLVSSYGVGGNHHVDHPDLVTYDQLEIDRVTGKKILEVLFILLLCVAGAKWFGKFVSSMDIAWLKMPDFVYALFFGVVITNATELSRGYKINSECVDILGTVSLSLFLAMALMNLKLWEIFDLAVPLLIILVSQAAILAVFAYFVTFRLMGSNYDAAVMAGGHCGFGMGATPTAVMNMGALVSRTGPSPQAFMVVPIVGAFFIDIVNAIILQGYLSFMG
ncbi:MULTISPECIES: sodium/glutamate symporter [unclassified Shewanella]|uniref:sodium/glutamate symporter n=1 Tax=unclassified Shewanella TaxID=196818 RepID=UPI0009712CFC|nr:MULTISPECIES: sodium/glutamate symporter [unclassified Shewanella]MDO6620476.1 sodium/glutamate symporter [Shewanella sp. 6_MG-2023]MDO6641472.1 sodium/glutamate symporter [Shewanella sp. 5_MG-2023]MDO6679607.1 sodium/glutamate symporter [Shewanella sp. 4_MG-2023]MDO6776568.1 sodium/glutamate symporter [Shewanella sp. 3_MG-2023]PMG29012.1 sodium/glutamate symporter [Shewanella sp. 10N.286.52.C2]